MPKSDPAVTDQQSTNATPPVYIQLAETASNGASFSAQGPEAVVLKLYNAWKQTNGGQA